MSEKLKFAFYWAASCGGCDVVVLDIDEKILDIIEIADIVFWPCAMDFKYEVVEGMEKDEIDVCFFNGAIRDSENEKIAKLLREKSKILIAMGSCSSLGGIPGLGNDTSKEEILEKSYISTLSTENPRELIPEAKTSVREGELTIPELEDNVRALGQVVEVDYYLPGCPTNPDLIVKAVEAIKKDQLPPKGTNLAILSDKKTVCDECDRELSEEKSVKEFKRIHFAEDNGVDCLLEQGIVCMGPATQAGCGARCIKANFPCRGCFGPPVGVIDQGAKMVSLLGSLIDSKDEKEVESIIEGITDPLGTFYSYSLPKSLLKRRKIDENRD